MKVTLIGAGPGDIGLMTVKAVEKLKCAEVVLYDRLISEDILHLIPENAEKINVGKNVSNHPIPQKEINNLLVEKAKQGFNVVRLKGGDPFVFGRGGEELELLAENNIPFEVIPGISSSIAGGAYAGIPVTHRDYTSSLHIITGHVKENKQLNINFDSLVKLNGTLVFMMSVSTISEICDRCISAGMDKDMPAAIIENATLNKQRKFLGTVKTLPEIAKNNTLVSPSVIIIGKVCELSGKLDWFSKKPLLGKKIIVTRARAVSSNLSAQLSELGATVIEMPSISICPLINGNEQLRLAVIEIARFSWLVFASSTGVDLFFEYLKENKIDIRCLHHLKIAAVGSETEKEISKHGIFVDYVPSIYSGEELAKGLLTVIGNNESVLIVRAKAGSEDIVSILQQAGISFTNVPIYETEYRIAENDNDCCNIDLITFTSSSTVEGFVKSRANFDYRGLICVCIGKKTAETAKKYGFQVIISEKSTINSMVEKIKELFESDNTSAPNQR